MTDITWLHREANGAWVDDAACAGWPSSWWFSALRRGRPSTGGDGAKALAICTQCPVRAECLAVALERSEVGIWGGTTDAERERMRSAANPPTELPKPTQGDIQ